MEINIPFGGPTVPVQCLCQDYWPCRQPHYVGHIHYSFLQIVPLDIPYINPYYNPLQEYIWLNVFKPLRYNRHNHPVRRPAVKDPPKGFYFHPLFYS